MRYPLQLGKLRAGPLARRVIQFGDYEEGKWIRKRSCEENVPKTW